MNKNHTISVVIPVFNGEPSIPKTLKSVFSQSKRPDEVIVVNDGSTDRTEDFIREEYPECILISQKNKGQGAARNKGLEQVSGDYIALLDADDYWKPQFLDITSAFLDDNPNVIAVNTGFLAKTISGEYVGPENIDQFAQTHPKGRELENFFCFWAKYDHVRTGTVLLRRSAIDVAGGQLADLRISQDLEYWGYLATFGKWGFIPKVLWVGDSASTAVKAGWQKKYRTRRKNCPDVEQWERRIVPRLTANQVDGFEKVRGRVAASFAQSKLLAGDSSGALHVVMKYGDAMPGNRLTKLLRWGARNKKAGWGIASAIVHVKDWMKGYGIG